MIVPGERDPGGRMPHPVGRTLRDPDTAPSIVYVVMDFRLPPCPIPDCPHVGLICLCVEIGGDSRGGKPKIRCQLHWWRVARAFDESGFAFKYSPRALQLVTGVN